MFRYHGAVAGEMTVSGDEMTYRMPLSFQRVVSSARATSQP